MKNGVDVFVRVTNKGEMSFHPEMSLRESHDAVLVVVCTGDGLVVWKDVSHTLSGRKVAISEAFMFANAVASSLGSPK